ncbi:hypothetical protein F3Y22_tig00112738pilonHSYRG01049 [Hibiscus syriacus]|uniref:Reverse transcriptase Ty1/copia-type domain-containing protein n=1 Tax=Hibiscus syriacus TaxID=106335 RepID=A0A6A2X787_HIBSY|nr:hypothetical protein F3Y22_tig00112738pilonHSYRG01049 [Hibiscus syriacus]
MKDEMDSLMSNQTWELAKLPPGKKALHNKWIYRIKEDHDGSKRYKARFVVKCFQQKECIGYNEIFSPVVKLSTIILVLKIVAAENLHLKQLDVKTDFLHGDFEEEIYMRQPEGFIEVGKKNLMPSRSLLLHQEVGQQLEAKIVEAVCYERSGRCKVDSWDEDQERHKAEYINKVLSRPDIAQVVGAVSRYMNNPGKVHWEAVKWILRYLRGTINKALCFKGGDTILTGYVDADLVGNVDIRRRTTGQQGDGLAPKFLGRVRQETRKQCHVFRQSTCYSSSKESVFSLQDKAHTVEISFYPVSYGRWDLKLEKISGAQNPTDMLTKMVTTDKLKLCSTSVGMLE